MIRICSYCCSVMGYKEGQGITHGTCETCKKKLEAEAIRLYNNSVVDRVNDLLKASPVHPAFKGGLK